MVKKLSFIFIAIALMSLFPHQSFAKNISSSILIEKPEIFNGKEITYEGEAIGDVMLRGRYAWIHVNDDPYSRNKRGHLGYNSGQAIWLPSIFAKKIQHVGGYFWRGDRVRVRGIFNRVCKVHGGDMDIHANNLIIVKTGHPIYHTMKFSKLIAVLILFTAAAVTYVLITLKRRERLETA